MSAWCVLARLKVQVSLVLAQLGYADRLDRIGGYICMRGFSTSLRLCAVAFCSCCVVFAAERAEDSQDGIFGVQRVEESRNSGWCLMTLIYDRK